MTCWMKCPSCGYKGEFVILDDKPIECPRCWRDHEHHVMEEIKSESPPIVIPEKVGIRATMDLWGFTREMHVSPEAKYVLFPAIGMVFFTALEFEAVDMNTEPRVYKFKRFILE